MEKRCDPKGAGRWTRERKGCRWRKRGTRGREIPKWRGKRRGKRERERKHHVLWEREWLSLLSPGLSRRFSSKRAINDAYTPWPHHHDHRDGVWWSSVVAMRRRRSSRWCSQEPNGFLNSSSRLFSSVVLSFCFANFSSTARSMDLFDHARSAVKCRSSDPAKNR